MAVVTKERNNTTWPWSRKKETTQHGCGHERKKQHNMAVVTKETMKKQHNMAVVTKETMKKQHNIAVVTKERNNTTETQHHRKKQ